MIGLLVALQISTFNLDCYQCDDWETRKPLIFQALPDSDIIAFQELSYNTPQFSDVVRELKGYDHCLGVVDDWNTISSTTFYKKGLGVKCLPPLDVNYSCSTIKKGRTTIYNCHLPWQDYRIEPEVTKLMGALKDGDVLVGDINLGESQNSGEWDRLQPVFKDYYLDRIDIIGLVGDSRLKMREPKSIRIWKNSTHKIVTTKIYTDTSYMSAIYSLLLSE